MIEQKSTNKSRLIGYALGAAIVAALAVFKLLTR